MQQVPAAQPPALVASAVTLAALAMALVPCCVLAKALGAGASSQRKVPHEMVNQSGLAQTFSVKALDKSTAAANPAPLARTCCEPAVVAPVHMRQTSSEPATSAALAPAVPEVLRPVQPACYRPGMRKTIAMLQGMLSACCRPRWGMLSELL